MSISETQLDSWSKQGSVTNSAKTHASIRVALSSHSWPEEMTYDVYLQGSYANTTNIRGDSDVDVVVECNSVYYSNIEEHEKPLIGWTPGKHSYNDFRREVIEALTSYYGNSFVDPSGANAIAVLAAPNSNRLKADVLPCVRYTRYDSLRVISEGLTFWNQHIYQQIINYPKIHINNGEKKNRQFVTNGWYKPAVRMFKNARLRIVGDDDTLRKRFPSYFVECLFYNVPDNYFGYSFQRTYSQVVTYLDAALKDARADQFTTQSEQHWLFGTHLVQWSKEHAADFVSRLIELLQQEN